MSTLNQFSPHYEERIIIFGLTTLWSKTNEVLQIHCLMQQQTAIISFN